MSLHAASVPIFAHILTALGGCLSKAEAHADARKIAHDVMLSLRLAPDMFDLKRQVQIACDFGTNTAGRLAGVELPRFPDDEQTFAELHARIAKTIAFVEALPATAFESAETRTISFAIGGKPMTMEGAAYLHHFGLPNFYFHATTAYAILRGNGVELGKRDFMGKTPGLNVG
ncbi:MAG: DUF1993 domain-containing protein [Beijerinckiaceae bacterium]